MLATVEVTESEIERGQASDCYNCPLALAINRVLRPEFECAAANPGIIFLREGAPSNLRSFIKYDDYKNGFPFFLPREAKLWMWDFDKKNKCYPFTFSVELPEEVLA